LKAALNTIKPTKPLICLFRVALLVFFFFINVFLEWLFYCIFLNVDSLLSVFLEWLWSVLLVEVTGGPGENHQPAASH
jgi:hypothetical protein